MIKRNLQRKLSLLMIRASLRGKYGMHSVAEKHGITPMQAMILSLLDPKQPVPMPMLSRFLTCDKSNITSIVDRLVARELIERQEWPQDRRVKMLTLTQKGLELQSTLLEIAAENRLPNLQRLTKEEADELFFLLDKATDIPSDGSIARQ